MLSGQIFGLINLLFTTIIGIYFYCLLKNMQTTKITIERESKKEIEKLHKLREIKLTQPLSEKTRPSSLEEVIGQTRGIRALKAALCGPNPQHVLLYGPPGIGKTAAARLILEEAKQNGISPFKREAKFVEIDATTMRFDDRGIADPLIGSVHDPIYQGAGAMGVAGIPQPKPGAVTRAHGGILFLDEIGELHPVQMNKLLKVLEDRKVFLESAYYNSEDGNIPSHIKDIFDNGLPADFRLVGATTRMPEEIPPAIRSRCVEIFFRNLNIEEIEIIALNGAFKGGFIMSRECAKEIAKYADSGRDAINIVQIAGGIAINEDRKEITIEDIDWVLQSGNYNPKIEKKVDTLPQIGYVNGLAVYGPNMGTVIEIEATAEKREDRGGKLTVTGIIDEEESGNHEVKYRRKSTGRNSIDNVLTVIKKYFKIDPVDYDIHINFPGGTPIDGPSAGIAITTAVLSAINKIPVSNDVALTGEVSIRGNVKPIGGLTAKIEAAKKAGVKRIIIPRDNWQDIYSKYEVTIIPVDRIEQAVELSLVPQANSTDRIFFNNCGNADVIVAKSN